MIYEYTLDSQIQLCLILERLFNEGECYLKRKDLWDNVHSLRIILEILKITEKRVLKLGLMQILQTYAKKISELINAKQVDKRKLNAVFKQITYYLESCSSSEEKYFGSELRKNSFLASMRDNYFMGSFDVTSSSVLSWLQQNDSLRTPQLFQWFGIFNKLRGMVTLVLKLLRTSVNWSTVKTYHGIFRVEKPPQLIRINLGEIKSTYPRFENFHRTSLVSFYTCEINHPSSVIDYDISFELALCRL